MNKDFEDFLKIGAGMLGGFVLLDILFGKCKKCGEKISLSENICPHCGGRR
ncbi:zinc-ribbon domain-containing protein [Candidatus Pacearchaeota archaeon]|nr:zinc-ribbon domain-containing protein [Candidatus Pacearchaeota archaeon]